MCVTSLRELKTHKLRFAGGKENYGIAGGLARNPKNNVNWGESSGGMAKDKEKGKCSSRVASAFVPSSGKLEGSFLMK